MAQHGFPINGSHGGGTINPGYVYGMSNHGATNGFSSGSALFDDEELLEGLNSPADAQHGLNGPSDYNGMNDHGSSYTQNIYGSHHNSLPFNQPNLNGYSNTPDGDPIQSPYVHGMNQYRPMPGAFAGSMQSPLSYGGSPLANGDMNNEGTDANYLKARARMSQNMVRKPSNNNSLTPKSAAMNGLSMNSQEGFPIRTSSAQQEKAHTAAQFIQTPNSLASFPTSGFSSPLNTAHLHNAQINDMLRQGGASMPAKLNTGSTNQATTQEAKRKRRRESHNLVERRRRDNINERIQDLSRLVPAHRLEDEKIRKAIQNGTPLSPTLPGIASPGQATSALAGPGARRATSGGTAGNITTGLPLDDKDKGPNKGDILNGAVSWTRDLMWMSYLQLQRQEEMMNVILELGGHVPFEISDDERRMQSELFDAITKNEEGTSNGKPNTFTYSRTAGSGLRVPHHTDYKGEPINGNGNGHDHNLSSISPDDRGTAGHMLDGEEFLDYDDDDIHGNLDNFKEEDEYGMDLTQ